MAEHRCLFCDHVFVGRRRKFCYDCLPARSDVHPKVYNAKYLMLYIACGLHPNSDVCASKLGPEFIPPKPPRVPQFPTECAECGVATDGRRKYCSRRCARAHIRHANRASTPPPVRFTIQPPELIIPAAKRREAAPSTLRSSRRNVRALVATMAPLSEPCADCTGDLRPWWELYNDQPRRHVCYECHLRRKRIAYSGKDRGPQIRKREVFTAATLACSMCGSAFQRSKHHRWYCSDDCKAQAESDKNRRQNARRRGARQGQPYTLRMIIDRDGTDCHLCGKRVDVSLSGSHRMGPTIDHLIPISVGGLDCFTNVALAHRSCNVARGTDGPAQLRLVG